MTTHRLALAFAFALLVAAASPAFSQDRPTNKERGMLSYRQAFVAPPFKLCEYKTDQGKIRLRDCKLNRGKKAKRK